MLKLRIIPCLDVKAGRVVKGVNFVNLRDAGDPVEQAALYDAAGADELTFLDITASHEQRPCTVLLGVGIGATMPSVLMQVQNAAARQDVGAATGSLLFLRSMGGAFGSTIVGALLVVRFNAGLHNAGFVGNIDLGALRGGADGMTDVGSLGLARTALAGGFQLSFAVCAVLLGVAVVIAAGMRDLQLRSARRPARGRTLILDRRAVGPTGGDAVLNRCRAAESVGSAIARRQSAPPAGSKPLRPGEQNFDLGCRSNYVLRKTAIPFHDWLTAP